MTIQESDYIDVAERATALGCRKPDGIAILPRNFDAATSMDELVYETSTLTIRSLWRQKGVIESRIEPEGVKFPTIDEKAGEWLGPIIFVSGALISQNPDAVTVALNIISSYLTDHFFKGWPGERKAKMDIVVSDQQTGKSKRVHYEGPVEGLHELPQVIEGLKNI